MLTFFTSGSLIILPHCIYNCTIKKPETRMGTDFLRNFYLICAGKVFMFIIISKCFFSTLLISPFPITFFASGSLIIFPHCIYKGTIKKPETRMNTMFFEKLFSICAVFHFRFLRVLAFLIVHLHFH